MSEAVLSFGVPLASFVIAAVSAVATIKIVGEATKELLDEHIKSDEATHIRFGATQQEILRAIGRLEGKVEELLRNRSR